ncbi:endonuclease/exonuclease/phosphatase family protein [Streptomyces sp. NBC_01803]|uniref:endonuclease/exonuclease/phosphatase family protein n=1 Tax=Streptomyces sp. NBC_01803 TaxID=2975946 RepID=UPI002DD98C6B|nr:endonuclease/exonuclease/phosphatase family protein [Streptomyces sp. NBC_01803]WSA43674.1 endonuclease/exonuclease/phosphatase family protein [Streptomyces sp. NBC_01803]
MTSDFERNGGGDRAKWTAMHERLRSLHPDLLLRQELVGCAAAGRESELWYDSEEMLGMRGWLGPGPGATALYISDAFRPVRNWANEVGLGLWELPPTVLSVILDGTTVPIVCGSVHLAYDSAPLRELESAWLTRLADKWRHIDGYNDQTQLPALIGGDFNSDPVPGPDGDTAVPKLPLIRDMPHRAHRSRPGTGRQRVIDTVADENLHTAGLFDTARHLAGVCGKPDVLAPTIAASPTHGPARRIDRIYLSAALTPAVENVEVIDMTGLSDHHALRVTLQRDTLHDLLSHWPVEHAAATSRMTDALP